MKYHVAAYFFYNYSLIRSHGLVARKSKVEMRLQVSSLLPQKLLKLGFKNFSVSPLSALLLRGQRPHNHGTIPSVPYHGTYSTKRLIAYFYPICIDTQLSPRIV